jgi:hypothetical protein
MDSPGLPATAFLGLFFWIVPLSIFLGLLYVTVRLAVRHAIRDIVRSTGGHGIYADGRTTSEPSA